MLTEPLTCGPGFKSWSGGACASGGPDAYLQILLEYDGAGDGKQSCLGACSPALPLSCQTSSQSLRSLVVNLPFPVAPKVSLSSRRNLFYSLLALFLS